MSHTTNNPPSPPQSTAHMTRYTPRTLYLTAFNTLFSALWASVFVHVVVLIWRGEERGRIFEQTEFGVRWLQSVTVVEILHSWIGLIKSPLPTTALQVGTRIIQVWLIWHTFPLSTAASLAYPALLLAWSVADGIRYAYLALNMHGMAPGWLVWIRYTMFYILYPIGIGAEWWLFYMAVEPGRKINGLIPPVFYFLLALYGPGSYKMYTYMIKQRRKTLGGKQRRS
ncbi:hypothetical protein IAQ61_007282 [Plenodomus lingam]|uniref:uncharacterized protein n=1 Tax=Leptosphaeria maculans TaxID=5022 RepID=UPI00331AAA82|nr:hypothetical protein IAQ61_007282 [Plenodomus lingam]